MRKERFFVGVVKRVGVGCFMIMVCVDEEWLVLVFC